MIYNKSTTYIHVTYSVLGSTVLEPKFTFLRLILTYLPLY